MKQRPEDRVLLVDDDPRLRNALRRALMLKGFQVELTKDAATALDILDGEPPDLIILDIMMPGLDGLRLCRLIRANHDLPILMLTALDSVRDRVVGLEAGADDYLAKPFATDELLARVNALLRRARTGHHRADRLNYADVSLDRAVWEVHRAGTPVLLTAKEFRLLERFMRTPEHVVTREELFKDVWDDDERVESNVVDVHVATLRQKLEINGRERLIQTIRGVGYILRAET
jgi:two-component system, OmpR family, response regulator MprA